MLHAFVLRGSSGLNNPLQRPLYPRVALAGLGPETTTSSFRSREHATFGVTYPTSPAPDNMTRTAGFQALGAFFDATDKRFPRKSLNGDAEPVPPSAGGARYGPAT